MKVETKSSGDTYKTVTPYIDPSDAIEMASEIYGHTGERVTIPNMKSKAKSAWKIADEKKYGRPSEGEIEARDNMY